MIEDANTLSEWIWSNYIKLIYANLFVIALFYLVSMAYCWSIGSFDTICFAHPVKAVLVALFIHSFITLPG